MVENVPIATETVTPRDMTWRPPERLTVSQWADKYRMVASSALAGRWMNAHTPYLAGVMDAFADPHVNMLTFVKSAQIGGTEAINNMLAYAIDQEPGPTLLVFPVEKDTRDEMRSRLVPMILDSPRLASHVGSRAWQTDKELELDSMKISMAWAKAPGTLIRRACRYVFIDEVDNCDMQAGRLGNTVALARKRTTTYGRRAKLVLDGTPSHDYASGWVEWEASDRREYWVPCPVCGTYQRLVFEQIKIEKDDRDTDAIRVDQRAWYECAACEAKLLDARDKRWMVERGVWVPADLKIVGALDLDDAAMVARAVFDHEYRWTPEIEGTKKVTDRAGFHINALYSLFVDWSSIISDFLESKDDPERFRVFYNSVLGLPWKNEVTKAVEKTQLEAKREMGLPRDVVNQDAIALIAFADVQVDRLYYGIRAWGENRRSWLVREGIVDDFDELWQVVRRTYRKENGDAIQVMYLAVDSGYRTSEVYEFARKHPGVLAVKGEQTAPYSVKPSKVDYTLQGTTAKYGVVLHRVNTSFYKEKLSRLIHVLPGDPGEFSVHAETTDDYCVQMTSESQVWKTVTVGRAKRRVAVWEPKTAHAANHYWDAEVYGLAIADFKGFLSTSEPSTDQTHQPRPVQPGIKDRPRYGRQPLGWNPKARSILK